MNRAKHKVAIGLPVYNGERFLEATLDCILDQNFKDFELIISDNASTDRSGEICRRYAEADSRIRYFRQEQNIGAVPNFNKVFELSNALYFKWAAVDDWIDKSYLQKAVDILDQNPDVVWCHSRSSHVDEHGRFLDDPKSLDVSYKERENPSAASRFTAILLNKFGCLDSYGLIRSDCIRQTSMFLPYYGPEKVFIAELSLMGRYQEIPETLFLVRVLKEGSGAVATAAGQQEFATGAGSGKGSFVRFRYLQAYVRAIRRSSLGIADTARCYRGLASWLLQISKWPRLLMRSITGRGIGGGNISRIKAISKSNQTLADEKK